MFYCLLIVFFTACNNIHNTSLINPNLLLGKWSGKFLDDNVTLLFSEDTVFINYHNGSKVTGRKYSLKNDTLYIERFEEKSKITELSEGRLSIQSLDTGLQESINIIYEIKFTKER